ncbi:MAG: metallophosphoesterase family protein [Desulfobacterales bacterium]|nr:metallophosphoesterase family protein [Desulfobacterales bacterium]
MIVIDLNQSAYRVGVISDTHGRLRPEAARTLQDVQLIIHAGDIDSPNVMSALREIAPVIAVRGNMDQGGFGLSLPETESIRIGTLSVLVLHDILRYYGTRHEQDFNLVITGHTHRPNITRSGPTTLLNPGSAGPKRSGLPISMAIIEFEEEQFIIRHVDLESLNCDNGIG